MTKNNPSCGARLLVLAGPATALLATILYLAAGISLRPLGVVWVCAALL